MQSLRWLPSSDSYGYYRYAPEAVLTQGWGTQWDLAHLATGLLARSGGTPKYRTIALTEEGKEALQKLPEKQAEEKAEAILKESKKGLRGFFANLFSKIFSFFKKDKEVPSSDSLAENSSLSAEEIRADEEEIRSDENSFEEEEYPEEEYSEEEYLEEEYLEEEYSEEEYAEEEYSDEEYSEGEYSEEGYFEGDLQLDIIPGISYQTPEGENKLFVIPFMKDITELEGLVYIPHLQSPIEYNPVHAKIRVSAKAESSGLLFHDAAGEMADILGGGDSHEGGDENEPYEYFTLLEKEVPLPSLSLDAIEVGYLEAGTGKGKRYTAALFTSEGIVPGTGIIDTGENPLLGVAIEIILPGNTLTHESPLQKGEPLNSIYHTLAINLPDLPQDSAKILEEASNKAHKSAENPDSYSILRWYSRNILERFIANQTIFDEEQQAEKGLLLGRTDKERCIVLTSRVGKDQTLYSTIDLLQVINQVHRGSENLQRGYNIFAGLFASSLESAVLTGKNKAGYQELWTSTPPDTPLLLITNDDEDREFALTEMRKAGKYPDRLLERLEESSVVVLVPEEPGEYQGQKRWAWLEMDPATYETISVIDTGEHAGMASYAMSLLPSQDDYGQFIVGALIGVDMAIWSVCSSALKLSEYKDILADAQKTALSFVKGFDLFMKGYSGVRDKTLTLDMAHDSIPLKLFGKINSEGLRVGIGQNFIGFTDGYKAGVNVYFNQARKN